LGVLHLGNKLHHCGKHVITIEDVYYVTTMLMVLGVKNDVQIGELHLKWCTNCVCVQWTCLLICSTFSEGRQLEIFCFLWW